MMRSKGMGAACIARAWAASAARSAPTASAKARNCDAMRSPMAPGASRFQGLHDGVGESARVSTPPSSTAPAPMPPSTRLLTRVSSAATRSPTMAPIEVPDDVVARGAQAIEQLPKVARHRALAVERGVVWLARAPVAARVDRHDGASGCSSVRRRDPSRPSSFGYRPQSHDEERRDCRAKLQRRDIESPRHRSP